jgi:hypothetical protein
LEKQQSQINCSGASASALFSIDQLFEWAREFAGSTPLSALLLALRHLQFDVSLGILEFVGIKKEERGNALFLNPASLDVRNQPKV